VFLFICCIHLTQRHTDVDLNSSIDIFLFHHNSIESIYSRTWFQWKKTFIFNWPKKEALLCSIENQSDWLINIQPMEILYLNYRCRSIQAIPFVNSRRQSYLKVTLNSFILYFYLIHKTKYTLVSIELKEKKVTKGRNL
jgi:hypothetical protein